MREGTVVLMSASADELMIKDRKHGGIFKGFFSHAKRSLKKQKSLPSLQESVQDENSSDSLSLNMTFARKKEYGPISLDEALEEQLTLEGNDEDGGEEPSDYLMMLVDLVTETARRQLADEQLDRLYQDVLDGKSSLAASSSFEEL